MWHAYPSEEQMKSNRNTNYPTHSVDAGRWKDAGWQAEIFLLHPGPTVMAVPSSLPSLELAGEGRHPPRPRPSPPLCSGRQKQPPSPRTRQRCLLPGPQRGPLLRCCGATCWPMEGARLRCPPVFSWLAGRVWGTPTVEGLDVLLSQARGAWKPLPCWSRALEAAALCGDGWARDGATPPVALLAGGLSSTHAGSGGNHAKPEHISRCSAKPQCRREHLWPVATVGIKISEIIK